MKSAKLALISLCALGLFAGCDSAREIEVTGDVSAAQTIAGPISLSFYEVDSEAESPERVLVKEAELAELGAFTETVEVAENTVIVFALADADGDGQCTAGELWAEAEQPVAEDDTIEPFQLELRADPCPAE
jgi:hypothetical protein